jgi:hypothetical protein
MGLTFEIQEHAKKDYSGGKVDLFVKVDAIDSSYPGGMVDDSSGRIRIRVEGFAVRLGLVNRLGLVTSSTTSNPKIKNG